MAMDRQFAGGATAAAVPSLFLSNSGCEKRFPFLAVGSWVKMAAPRFASLRLDASSSSEGAPLAAVAAGTWPPVARAAPL